MGVSKSTVSRVISDQGYVKNQTRDKINKAIEELDYSPNYLARGMRTNKSATIGLFIPDFSNPFYVELFKGIEQVTRNAGYTNVICHTAKNPKAEMDYIKELLNSRIDGIILNTYHTDPENLRYFRALAKAKPIVFMDPVFHDDSISYVVSDGFSGTKSAVKHLVDSKCKRIAYINGPKSHAVTKDRYNGYLVGIKEAGLTTDQRFIYNGDFSLECGRAAVEAFLNQKVKPDAIVSATDVMAIGAMNELTHRSIRVPEDIRIIGFDNIPLAQLVRPALTTVAQPILELGENAAELLLKKIENPDTPNRQVVMQCSLIKRESA
ncbi:MAG: LacI family DNA-binding transcriptional regulator [Spirochaetales bacterium]|nr:LacI family DNA-binding transcriptional regulator [Spirochaetales bacterium]